MDAGWQTNVTKERLNGILMAFGLPTIYQKNWQWYIGEEKRTGEKIFNVQDSDSLGVAIVAPKNQGFNLSFYTFTKSKMQLTTKDL